MKSLLTQKNIKDIYMIDIIIINDLTTNE
jgi:hypothetical protein